MATSFNIRGYPKEAMAVVETDEWSQMTDILNKM